VPPPPLEPDPPHATNAIAGIVKTATNKAARRTDLRGLNKTKPKIPINPTPKLAAIPPSRGPAPDVPVPALDTRTPAVGPVVVIVIAEVAACVPSSVTDGGTNAHAAPAGNPVQLNITVCVDPFAGVTVKPTMPEVPAATVTDPGVATTLKSPTAAFTTCVTAGDAALAA
jgi:hypothetical protein